MRSVHPNRLTPKGIAILAVIGLLLLALGLYFLPWPERVELRMNGAKVDRQGNAITEGEIIFEGWRYHYLFQSDKFKLTKVDLPDVQIGSIIDAQGDTGFYPSIGDTIRCIVGFWVPKDGLWHARVFTTENYDYLVIYEDDGNIFVASALEMPDYAQILDACYLLEE